LSGNKLLKSRTRLLSKACKPKNDRRVPKLWCDFAGVYWVYFFSATSINLSDVITLSCLCGVVWSRLLIQRKHSCHWFFLKPFSNSLPITSFKSFLIPFPPLCWRHCTSLLKHVPLNFTQFMIDYLHDIFFFAVYLKVSFILYIFFKRPFFNSSTLPSVRDLMPPWILVT